MKCKMFYRRFNEKRVATLTVEEFETFARENENPACAGFREIFVVYEDGQMFSWIKGCWQEWIRSNPADCSKMASSFIRKMS